MDPSTLGTTSTSPQPIDWAALIVELNAMAVDSLGNRAQKITNVLVAADESETGIEAAIHAITKMTLVFVDPVRLADLAVEMRAHVAVRTGKPPPARLSAANDWTTSYTDAGVMAAMVDGNGCLGSALLCTGVVLAFLVVR